MKKIINFIFSFIFLKQLLLAAILVLTIFVVLSLALQHITNHNKTVRVPEVIGLDAEKANEVLTNASLQVKEESQYSADQPANTVIEQYPKASAIVKPSQTIYLTIASNQAAKIKVPQVIGLSFYEAKTILENEKFGIGGMEYAPDVQRDVVMRVLYEGEELEKDQPIPMFSKLTLVLGNGFGSKDLKVPNLIGLSIKEVLFALRSAGLILGTVVNDAEDSTKDLNDLKVYKQEPNRNSATKLSQGDKIDIYLQ